MALVEKTGHAVFVSLGTNLGDRGANLRMAQKEMAEGVEITAASSVYETPPWGVVDQPAFLNQVVGGVTFLSPLKLLTFLKKVEQDMGRVKTYRFGPRLIDMDILLYDDRQVCNPRLTIPHPRMCQRAFVLIPLAEIAPDTQIPGTEMTVRQHLAGLEVSGIIKLDTPNQRLER
jgi:2-amino-4-hydroxy-6-hydroxymethyldihydropteridine diphosphokinase